MAYGSKVSATQLTSITTEQFFSFSGNAYVALAANEVAVGRVKMNPPGTPTDHMIVAFYTTLDDSSETWDTQPFLEILVANSPDPNWVAWRVEGVYKFRIGVRRSGSTDTITDADCEYRIKAA